MFENLNKGDTKNGLCVDDGIIPLISAKKVNNGICGYV